MARRFRPIEVHNVVGARNLANQADGILQAREAILYANNYTNPDVLTNIAAARIALQQAMDFLDGCMQAINRDPSLT